MSRRRRALIAVAIALGAISGEARGQVRDRPPRTDVAPLGTITGRVDIEVDRQRVPVRRARMTLSADLDGKESTTETDTDGRYRFERVTVGTYRIHAEKLGFVPMSSNPAGPIDPPAAVEITAGATVTVNLQMQRGAALEGRFLNGSGDPIANVVVTADRLVQIPDGQTRTETRWETTDDLGRFRVHTLLPGRYYLHATSAPPAISDEVYYPGTTAPGPASVLTLTAGQTLDHLDFTAAAAPLSDIAAETLAAREQHATRSTPPLAITRIAGRITRSDTGSPLANATAQLVPPSGGIPQRARADDQGRFEFTAMSAGSYVLTAHADGYVAPGATIIRPDGAGKLIEVKDGDRVDKADLALAPTSAIDGSALDEFGDPAPSVSIEVAQVVFIAGRIRLVPNTDRTKSSTTTDDRGRFRIYGLSAGDYYVLALPGPFGRPKPSATSLTRDIVSGFAATYFPGTVRATEATPVHVDAGQDVAGVRVMLVAARTTTISGAVTDVLGRPMANARLTLLQTQNGDVQTLISAPATTVGNGTFTYHDVPPGTYVLQGFGTGMFGSLPVTVSPDAGASLPVVLALRPMTTARGHVFFEGGNAPQDRTRMRVVFQPTDFDSGAVGYINSQPTINDAWDFQIPQLYWTGVIRVIASSGWALKSVRLDGHDITDTPYDFRIADVSGLEVVMTSRLGAVSGTVLDGDKPATDYTVIVFSDDGALWTFPSRFISVARPNQQGTFSTPGLLPGAYLAVAVPFSVPEIDPVWLAALRPFATPVTVSDGTTAPLTLKMVTR